MAKYMLLLGGAEKSPTPDYTEVMAKYVAWGAMLRERGHFVATNKLFNAAPAHAAKLTWQNGRVVDGPFVESKETLGGYYVIEAKSLEEAIAIARECPTVAVQKGFVEVRAIEI